MKGSSAFWQITMKQQEAKTGATASKSLVNTANP
jgi:hypothetical protein